MKQMKPKEVKTLEEMDEHEKDCEELYIKEVEKKNRLEKIEELKGNLEKVDIKQKKDLKKIDFMIEEKNLIAKYGTDVSVLNQQDEFKDLLKRMIHFEVADLKEKINEINEKTKDFKERTLEHVEDYEAELQLIESRIAELKENGAELKRDVPTGSYLKVEE